MRKFTDFFVLNLNRRLLSTYMLRSRIWRTGKVVEMEAKFLEVKK